MTTLMPRLFGDLSDWFDADFPFAGSRMQTFRVEDYIDQDRYVVRAELPGIDPDKDVAIRVSSGMLDIHAERREESRDRHHSEFRYGSLHRALRLPAGVDEKKVKARYADGILEVSVPIPTTETSSGRAIPIEKS